MLKKNCAKHPKYQVKRKPRADCAACRGLWRRKQGKRPPGRTIQEALADIRRYDTERWVPPNLVRIYEPGSGSLETLPGSTRCFVQNESERHGLGGGVARMMSDTIDAELRKRLTTLGKVMARPGPGVGTTVFVEDRNKRLKILRHNWIPVVVLPFTHKEYMTLRDTLYPRAKTLKVLRGGLKPV